MSGAVPQNLPPKLGLSNDPDMFWPCLRENGGSYLEPCFNQPENGGELLLAIRFFDVIFMRFPKYVKTTSSLTDPYIYYNSNPHTGTDRTLRKIIHYFFDRDSVFLHLFGGCYITVIPILKSHVFLSFL